jgi:hypothetical protein
MPKLIRHFKVLTRLSEAERQEYERLLASPASTTASLKAWLVERGHHDVSDGAIQRHRRHWQKDVLDVRRQAEAAYHFTLLAKGMDTSGLLMADAAQLRLEQAFFTALHTLPEQASADAAAHFGGLAKVLLDVLKARKSLEEARDRGGRDGGGVRVGARAGLGGGEDVPETKVDPSAMGQETARRVAEALGMATPHGATDAVLDAVEIRVQELLPTWRQREKDLPRVPLTEADKRKWAGQRQREAAARDRRGQR